MISAATLGGCLEGVLDPKEPIAFAERQILFNSLAIMPAIVIPTILNAPAGPVGNDDYFAPHLRRVYKGPLILNGSYTRETATNAVKSGTADAISFGRLFISNPDLPERFRLNPPLNPVDVSTFYTPGPRAYTDYPTLHASATGDPHSAGVSV